MSLELFLVHGSPYAWRVQLALEHKQLTYETHVLQFSDGSLKAPDYLAKNPRGRVPTLKDGVFVLHESMAILAYLERKYPRAPLFGDTPEETGRIWCAISEYTSYVDPAVEAFILPLYFGQAEERAAAIRAAAVTLDHELGRYEAALSRSPYLVGATVTAADLVVFPHVRSILRASSKEAARAFDLPFLPISIAKPHLAAWLKRIEGVPGYERTFPPHWR